MSRLGGKRWVIYNDLSMYYLYIFKNDISGRHYIGSTNDIARRLAEHNRGQTKSTRRKGNWILIYTEEYVTYKDASLRERMIKSYKGGNAFKKLIASIVHR